ncbi:hypothetical protein RRG08_011605 [Elysia crispata]|uniref:Uncharacterized protein n=1 Tax=Elysia crispata TaxID=231223 RepID=A0AAE0XP76_9GAST|nr:hypothetical protein RRG08_011605 [Elysia crispata]
MYRYSIQSVLRLLLFTTCLCLGPEGILAYDDVDAYFSTRTRLIRMEKKLNILTNEMDRLTATGSQDGEETEYPHQRDGPPYSHGLTGWRRN